MTKRVRAKAGLKPKVSRPFMPGYGILDAKKGRGLLPWSWAKKRFAKSRNYLISTTREDGRPHLMPVWGVWIEDIFYFSTGARSQKARNLASNPNCSIGTVHEKDEESILVEGVAKSVSDKALMRNFSVVYQAKYDYDMSSFNEPVYAVRPRAAFAFSA